MITIGACVRPKLIGLRTVLARTIIWAVGKKISYFLVCRQSAI